MEWFFGWSGVIGTLVSLSGAWLAWQAAKEAQKAAVAAERARQAIQRQTFAEMCSEALRDADALRHALRSQNWELLQVEAEKLSDWCIRTINQYADSPADVRRSLIKAHRALKALVEDVPDAKSSGLLAETAAQVIPRNVDVVCECLNEAAGIARRLDAVTRQLQ